MPASSSASASVIADNCSADNSSHQSFLSAANVFTTFKTVFFCRLLSWCTYFAISFSNAIASAAIKALFTNLMISTELFFLEHLLSDTNVEYRLNNTYTIEDKRPVVSVNIMGGLGNQLFQIATAYAYAKKENGSLKIVKKRDNGNRPVYWDVFKKLSPYLVENSSDLPQLKQWHERGPTEYTDIEPLSYPGIFLNGYLQSSKYFNKYAIKKLFKINNLEINTKDNKYQYLLDNSKRVIVIHARRTDYITFKEVHGPLDVDYYKKAIDMMLTKVENPLFVLTSDDNSFWDQIKLNHEHVIVNDTDINTFILLQKFNNFIMANSTFIWWVVWLSNAKNVIAPSKWFGPKGPKKYEDIYEDSWIRI